MSTNYFGLSQVIPIFSIYVKTACNIWNDWPFAKYQKSEAIIKGETMKEFAAKIAADDDFAKQFGELRSCVWLSVAALAGWKRW
jgi:hypothetical protein